MPHLILCGGVLNRKVDKPRYNSSFGYLKSVWPIFSLIFLISVYKWKIIRISKVFFPMIINFLIFYNIIYPNGQLSKYVFCKMKLMFILNSIYIAESVIKQIYLKQLLLCVTHCFILLWLITWKFYEIILIKIQMKWHEQ